MKFSSFQNHYSNVEENCYSGCAPERSIAHQPPGMQFSAFAMRKKIKILFLAASPLDSSRLRLDEELREIKKQILMASERDRFELISESAVTYDDLQRALLRYKPDIVHFSGHGHKTQGGIILEDLDGNGHVIDKPELIELFKILKDNIRIVVLNACYSRRRAGEFSKVINYTIAVKTTISDEAAIAFATSFYQGLAHGRLVKGAFDLANNGLKVKGVAKSKLPELLMPEWVTDAPIWTPDPIRPIVKIVIQITIAIILIIGSFLIWQNNLWKSSIKASNSNQNLMPGPPIQDPKIRERYAEAAKQLSSQNVIDRTNAIYSLGKLASDPNFDGYEETIRTLAAFIRENSKPKKNGSLEKNERIPSDIQAALEVLGWRKRKWGDEGESQKLDLSGAYLREADLKHGAEPEGAHLESALFINTNLERALLREVNLQNAIFTGANLRDAILYKANLENAKLLGADLQGADLQWAKGLTVQQIKEAKNWDKAIFTQEFEDELRADK